MQGYKMKVSKAVPRTGKTLTSQLDVYLHRSVQAS